MKLFINELSIPSECDPEPACCSPQVAQLHAAALAEDASVFAYDEVYDSLKESEKPKAAEKKERRSRYVEGLLDKAKERNKEQDIVYERQ